MPLKWLWNRQQTPSEPPADDAESPLAQRIAALETALTALQLQWQETLDKLGRWSSRQAARERARVSRDLDELAGDGPETHEDAPGSTNGAPVGVEDARSLDAAQRAIVKAQLRARISPRR